MATESAKRKAAGGEPENAAPAGAAAGGAVDKRARVETALVLADGSAKAQQLIVREPDAAPKRTSQLKAPNMLLEGHAGMVFTCKFNPTGRTIASGSFDKEIFLWNVYGDCENFAALKGHNSAVLDVDWSASGEMLYSVSADKTGAVWDVEQLVRVRKLRDHSSFVSSVCATRHGDPILATGSDDCTVKIWDARVRGAQASFALPEGHRYPVTSVAFSDDALQLFSGGIDNDIRVWDVRAGAVVFSLVGHQDTITGMSVSRDGSFLLSNGMDNVLRQWDIRPFVKDPNQRMVKVFQGARHDLQKNLLKCSWSHDGTKVAAGSADRFVYIWDAATARLLYKLPGHTGAVNEVNFHPKEPIIASCSNDKKVFMGEVD